MQKLKGKTALITGGTSGIGLATAKLFLEHGARVVITGRDAAVLEHARKSLGHDVIAIQSDSGKIEDIEQLMRTVAARLRHVDVLFVNAAVAGPAAFEHVSESQFDELANVNFKGVFFTIQKALPLLTSTTSVIVTTSIANQMGAANFSVYAACKAALRSLVQSLALELIGKGIRVNAISPGPIATPIWSKFGLPSDAADAVKDEVQRKSPAKRFGESEEVAQVALFLASDDSSYIVGHEIVIDGGMSLL